MDHISSLSIELSLIRARNICVKPREVFVRCYLPTHNKRVRIDSQEIPSNPNFTWINQTFSLNCVATQETLRTLKQGTIIFELRCRSSASCLARISGSKLLARAEMPWNHLVAKPDMEIDPKWVVMIPKNSCVYIDDILKPPAAEIAMKVVEVKERRRRWDSCGGVDCGCNSWVDYDLFALDTI